MKRIYFKLLSLFCTLAVLSPVITYLIFNENQFSNFVLDNTSIFIILNILGLIGGFTIDSWWKKKNPTLGY